MGQEGTPGPTTLYLERRSGEEFAVSAVVVLEFLEAYEQPSDGESFLEPFPCLAVTRQTARVDGQIRRTLRQNGGMIGDFDILIAATALDNGMALVTDNTRHFARIEGLVLEGYRGDKP